MEDGRPDRQVDASLTRLRSLGQRVTPAREGVVTALAATDQHLGAAEIAERCATQDATVHRATVYRALATLTDLGVVTHTHTSGAGAVYHLADVETSPGHAHLECTSCSRLIDVPAALLTALASDLARTYAFTLEPDHSTLLGLCSTCSAEGETGARTSTESRSPQSRDDG